MKVLITGGNGLVGNAIKNKILDRKNYCFLSSSSKDCDLKDTNQVRKIFESFQLV